LASNFSIHENKKPFREYIKRFTTLISCSKLETTDASERLQLAIKKEDNIDMDRTTTLIEFGKTKSKQNSEQLSKVTEEIIKIEKKKRKISPE